MGHSSSKCKKCCKSECKCVVICCPEDLCICGDPRAQDDLCDAQLGTMARDVGSGAIWIKVSAGCDGWQRIQTFVP